MEDCVVMDGTSFEYLGAVIDDFLEIAVRSFFIICLQEWKFSNVEEVSVENNWLNVSRIRSDENVVD